MLQITLDNRVGKCDFEPHSVLQREMLVCDSWEILFYLVLFIFLGLFILRKREWERGRKRGKEKEFWCGARSHNCVMGTRAEVKSLMLNPLSYTGSPHENLNLRAMGCFIDWGLWFRWKLGFSSTSLLLNLTTFLGAMGSFLQLRETLFALKIQDWNRSERWGSWRTWKLWCSYQICVLGKSWWHWLDNLGSGGFCGAGGSRHKVFHRVGFACGRQWPPLLPTTSLLGRMERAQNREVHNFLIYVFLSLKPLKQPSITLIIRITVVTNSILLFL